MARRRPDDGAGDGMSLLEQPLPLWAKQLARLPLLVYRLRLGRLLGHRFLVVVHRGRRTGTLYRTVVEVVRWDPARREAVVASGWGERASWLRNLRAEPAAEVWIADERFVPEQRLLELDERVEVLRDYERRHPRAARIIAQLLGFGGGDDALAAAAERLPMVAFRERLDHVSGRGRYLTFAQARRFYDRLGRVQDTQALYEHRATRELLAHADFEHATAVFELGYGTGALAERLLDRHLPAESRYVGIDVSPHMHELARHRLRRHAGRAELHLSDGSLRLPFEDEAFDRFVANYVLDLLSPADIRLVLGEAKRLLDRDGLLCLTSLTPGATVPARLVTRIWQTVWSLRPELVGGCRPIHLLDQLDQQTWTLRRHTVVTTLGISSEIVVAAKS